MSPAPSSRPRPWLLPLVVLGAVLLHLPSLGGGFYVDDHVHQLALEGRLPLGPLGLYDFGGPADWDAFSDRGGGFPWWTSPDWKIRFFRPLSSASLWLDHALWGAEPAGYHATSLVLFALLLLAAHSLHRALGLGRGAATTAVALLGASQATVLPVGWIANRNSLLAALFTTAAVAAAASHARLGRGRSLAAALALSVAAGLSKESGVFSFALVAAYVSVADPEAPRPWARRAAAASLTCAVAWVVALASAGFGTRSLFYATPWSDPLRFAANLATLAALGPLAMVTPAPPDLALVVPETTPFLLAAAAVVVVPLALWARRRLRGDRTAGFLLLWTALSLLPEASAPPSDRLLVTATVGASGLLALLVSRTLPRAAGRTGVERAAAAALVLAAGVAEGLVTFGMCRFFASSADDLRDAVLAADVGAPSLGRRDVLVLQADDPLVPFSIAATWAFRTRDLDVRFAVLQTGGRGLRWTRDDDLSMTFESLDRPFVTDPFEVVYRSRDASPPVGTRISTPAFDVEVLQTADPGSDPGRGDVSGGGVRRIRLRCPEPPDAARFRFLVPREGRLVAVPPPPPGATVELPAIQPAGPFAR